MLNFKPKNSAKYDIPDNETIVEMVRITYYQSGIFRIVKRGMATKESSRIWRSTGIYLAACKQYKRQIHSTEAVGYLHRPLHTAERWPGRRRIVKVDLVLAFR